jgi:carboxypeptidase Taq
MMPPGAADARDRQITALAGIIHEKRTSPSLGALLTELHAKGDALRSELNPYEM